MIASFKLCKIGKCGISVIGLEQDAGHYLDPESIVFGVRDYTYELSVTLNSIYSVDALENETLIKYEVKDHRDFPIDDSDFDMPKDGIYNLSHLILPNESWIEAIQSRSPEEFETFYKGGVYYYDKQTDSFKKYISEEELIEVSIEDILEIFDLTDTTIIRGDKSTFNMCYINECFYKLCNKILAEVPKKCNTSIELKEMIYMRDVIWMGINAIKYAIETQLLFQALNILDNLITCWSICNDIKTTYNTNSCGCH